MGMSLSRIGLLSVLALAGGTLTMWLTTSANLLGMFTQAVIYAIFALGVGVLLRQSGLVSFGHALFFVRRLRHGVNLELQWMPAELALLVILVAIGVLAFAIGLVIVRVPGIAFGMLTLAIGQMAYLLASRSRGITGGADGMGSPGRTPVRRAANDAAGARHAVHAGLDADGVRHLHAPVALAHALWRHHRGGSRQRRARALHRASKPRCRVPWCTPCPPWSRALGLLSALNTGFVSPESLHWSVSAITLLMVVVGGFKESRGPHRRSHCYFCSGLAGRLGHAFHGDLRRRPDRCDRFLARWHPQERWRGCCAACAMDLRRKVRTHDRCIRCSRPKTWPSTTVA